MKKKTKVFFFVILILLILFSGGIWAVAKMFKVETINYTILKKDGNFEIRQYPSYLVAETVVDSSFKEAGNVAFRRLFNYISGKNVSRESISMTAPVNQQGTSEKIAMTSPVNQQRFGDKYSICFVMPSKYSMETLPKPLDSSVTIKEIPAHKTAAVRYSGSWKQKRYNKKKTALEQFIQQNKLVPTGQAIFARYDPPFQLWFLRRNEVLIPIE